MDETEQRAGYQLSAADVDQWLSSGRIGRYLAECAGDLSTALELYSWNSQVASSAFADTCHLEVALRNAYDRELSRNYPGWAASDVGGLFDRAQGHPNAQHKQRNLNIGSKKLLSGARTSLGSAAVQGKVIANLSFGFWARLTEKDRTALFWSPMLYRAFPPGTRRSTVHDLINRVTSFRNRLAHNEPVFSSRTGLVDRLTDVQDALTLLTPAVAGWTAQRSQTASLVAACPVQGLIGS